MSDEPESGPRLTAAPDAGAQPPSSGPHESSWAAARAASEPPLNDSDDIAPISIAPFENESSLAVSASENSSHSPEQPLSTDAGASARRETGAPLYSLDVEDLDEVKTAPMAQYPRPIPPVVDVDIPVDEDLGD